MKFHSWDVIRDRRREDGKLEILSDKGMLIDFLTSLLR